MLELVIAPDNRLRVNTKPVKKITPQLLQEIKEMVKLTKTFVDPEGVGLASTQVGSTGQYFVAKMEDGKFKTFFNPKINKTSKKQKSRFEGCLSIPNYYGEVDRFIWVRVTYTNEAGEQVEEKATGLLAWVIQHEVDHLTGKLFMDHILENKSKLYKVVGKDAGGSDTFEQVTV